MASSALKKPLHTSGPTVTVVDASVLVAALTDDERSGEVARARLRKETLFAPVLVDVEVLSALRRKHARGELSATRAAKAVDWLLRFPVRRAPHRPLLRRSWELRDNVTPYDAAYIALAERLGTTLLTTDARLARAPGIRCNVEVLTS